MTFAELDRMCGNCNYGFPDEPGGADIAEKALTPILESPQFSYRIKKRIKAILRGKEGLF